MKKFLAILLLSLLLVACDMERGFVEEKVEFVGNIFVDSKRDEDVAVFKRPNGELLNLFWEDEPFDLEEGATYRVRYQTNDTYTDYMALTGYDKVVEK